MIDNRFYTYAYLRKVDRTPYYIGKGTGKRAYDRHTHRVKVPDDMDRIIFLKENISEREAWDYEREMIQFYGRKDLGTGILRNMTDGGEGPANPSPETRRRNAETSRIQYQMGIGIGGLTEEQEERRKENAKKGKAEWDKLHPEMCGGSLGRTPEQHSADSARAAQKGIVQWTKDKWENDPEWAAEKREISRQTALKNIELGIGIGGLTKDERRDIIKNLFADPVKGPKQRKLLSEKGKNQYTQGIGIASEEAKQKAREVNFERTTMEFTVVSPWGETFSEKGIRPFCRKMNISHSSLRSVIHGRAYMVNGWHLPKNDPLLPLKLFREGKTKEEVGEIIGIEIGCQVTNLFPPPKEGYKWCSCCFKELLIDQFPKNIDKYGKPIRRSQCKTCTYSAQRKARLDRG